MKKIFLVSLIILALGSWSGAAEVSALETDKELQTPTIEIIAEVETPTIEILGLANYDYAFTNEETAAPRI
ncbi:hypothetical protein NO2_1256 [Candidatus Termititenax persephonae]|uniref:Uncharacterized protein n=1 Tax=Candidatus Termititenax persephonae TaxID=2218525 RepID=A0A388TJU8_9BACT|nr:hypothetical protein NO2_1256 [Candidatus Termititenax persephonae]